jgi:hypothetical protein
MFVEEDGKRLAMIAAGLGPELGKVLLSYLGLFKPVKQGLRLARAVKLAQEVADLVTMGTVCKDERSSIRRPATPSHWAAGMDTMLTQRSSLVLPLESHGYLRAVVYGLADKFDAQQERQRETEARTGRHLSQATGVSSSPHQESKLDTQLAYIDHLERMDQITAEEATAQRQEAFTKFGGSNG